MNYASGEPSRLRSHPIPTVVTMLNRVAVLSDIHGVLPALEAVLAEPEVSAADRIVLTGDITAGPQPTQVLDLLIGLGDRIVWISGNADRELLEYRRGQRDSIPDPIAPWAAEQLREDHLDLLGRLPRSLSLPVRGFGEVLFAMPPRVTMKRSSWWTHPLTAGERSSANSTRMSARWSADIRTCRSPGSPTAGS